MKIQKIISGLAVITVVAFYILSMPQKVYSDTVGFNAAKKLNALGILYTGDKSEDSELSSFLEEKTTKTIAYLSALGLTGTRKNLNTVFYNTSIATRFYKSDNIAVYQNTLEALDYISSTYLSAADCYRIMLEVLGYGNLKETSDSDIMQLAINAGFGYIQPVVENESITNGILSNILFETLYVNSNNTEIPIIHTLATIDPDFLDKAKELHMIDLFPNLIPMFTEGSYKDESFIELSGTDITTNVSKNEWSAVYLNVKKSGYDSYKEKLVNRDWILEVEFEKETGGDKELCVLYYKVIEGKEHYITLVFNEVKKTCELWYAY